MPTTVRVWDLPTRVFHWALLLCVVGSFATGYTGRMEWHARFGYTIIALLMFRIVWGFVGGHWSRFPTFAYSPRSVIAYLQGRGHPDHLVGHNPLGAGSVFAMILVLLAQGATGLVADDEISFTGPLNRFLESGKALAATWYHKEVGQRIIMVLVLLHLGAILFYVLRKKERLIRPMIDGDKRVSHSTVSSRDTAGSRLLALVVFGVCCGFVAWVAGLRAAS